MKKSALFVVALMALMFGLSSCEKANNTNLTYDKVSWGILSYVNGNYLVWSDAGENFYVTNVDEFESSVFPGRKNDRVLIGYNEVGSIDPAKSYYMPSATSNKNIEVVIFLPFVTSDKNGIKTFTHMTEEELTAMGDDPLTVKAVSFGNGHINIEFTVSYNPVSEDATKHKLTMIYDDDYDGEAPDGKWHFWLMHNAFTDLNGPEEMYTFSTFNLFEILPEGTTEADIVLHWYDYHSDTNRSVVEWDREYKFSL